MESAGKNSRGGPENTEETTRAIPLMRRDRKTKTDSVVGMVTVDAADFAALSVYRWGMLKSGRTFYAYRQEHIKGTASGTRSIYMHREILGLPQGTGHAIEADHINHDGLDNRRANLRVVTRNEQNQHRRAFTGSASGVPGVSFCRGRPGSTGSWVAQVKRDGQYIHRSSHKTMGDAIAARNEAVAAYDAKAHQVSA